MGPQELRDALRAAALGVAAHEEAPQTAEHEERGVRIERRPEDRQVRPHGLDQLGAADDRAAHHVAMAGHVLGQAVHVEVEVEIAVAV